MTREYFLPHRPSDLDESVKVSSMNFQAIWLAYQESTEDHVVDFDTFWRERYRIEAEKLVTEASHVQYDTYPSAKVHVDDEGNVTLRAQGHNRALRDVYDPDGDKSEYWEEGRKVGLNGARHRIERDAVCDFERHLAEIISTGAWEDGDTFVWVSPPPTQILCDDRLSEEEKLVLLKHHGYDFHSNTSIYQLRQGDDGLYVDMGILQSYLHPQEHDQFLETVAGVPASEDGTQRTDHEYLAKIHKVTNTDYASVGALVGLSDDLYEATPQDRKLVPDRVKDNPGESPFADPEHVREMLKEVEDMLFYSYCFLANLSESDWQHDDRVGKLAESFTAWKNAAYMLIYNEADKDLEEKIKDFKRTAREDLSRSAREELALMRRADVLQTSDRQRTVIETPGRMPVYDFVADIARMQVQGFDPACGFGESYGFNDPRLFGYAPTYEATMMSSLVNPVQKENLEAEKALKALSFNPDNRVSTIPCPGCGTHPKFKASEVQKSCRLDCCSGKNGAKGKMTDPCGLMGILKTSIPDPDKAKSVK